MFALLLTACGGGGGGPTAATGPADPTGPGTQTPPVTIGERPAGVGLAGQGTYRSVGIATGEAREGESTERVLEFLHTHVSGGPWHAGPAYTYEHNPGLPTFRSPPTVRIAEGSSDTFEQLVMDVVAAVNAALPSDRQIAIGAPAPVGAAIEAIPDSQIFFDQTPTSASWNLRPEAVYRPGSEGLAQQDSVREYDFKDGRWEQAYMRAAHVWHSAQDTRSHWFSTLLHEFVHTLGLSGHVDQARFPDSVMRDQYLLITTSLPTIDADALNAAYTRLSPGTEPEELSLASLGPWADTRFHLQGSIGDTIAFGASTRNGIASAWASGPAPASDLADNASLAGSARWNGALLGFTPTDTTVAGDAAIGVDLAALTGNADFTELEAFGVRAAPGKPGTGTPWLDGDLRYAIAVTGNGFRKTTGDDGDLTGSFVGRGHEGAVGTLERRDLTAAFGGTR